MIEQMPNKPNLFIVGAQKCGTTRLSYLLNQHPDIFISSLKEPELFNHPIPPEDRVSLYKNLFAEADDHKIIGEASTVYSREKRFPGTAQRMYEFNPSARIIYIVRHPLDRMESAWVQKRSEERSVPADFCKAVKTSQDILDATLYWKQLNCYRQFFSDDNILLLFFEDFVHQEQEVVRRCCSFLQVDFTDKIVFDGKERNSFTEKKQAKPTLDLLRSLPLYEQLRHLIPKGPKRKLKGSLLQPVATKPLWDRETLAWSIEQIQGDARKLLRYAGKADDFWKLSTERAVKY